MLTKQFLRVIPLLEKIEEHNHEAYFVGGCVRDLILQRSIKDIDITTSATPSEIQQIFPNVIPVGIEHGTVIVRFEKESYEVTTFRTEGDYSDGRHPDHVEFIRNIEQDLERRDFTMNALAMDKEGNIIDLFGGKNDLENRLIRTVGNGRERFNEDALRIIRALRFSSQLGFQIEERTYDAMVASKQAILDISIERITKEMELFFAGDSIKNGINYLVKTKISDVLPIFKDHPGLINELPEEMKPLHTFAEVIAYFQFRFPEISIQQWVKAWKCSNHTKRMADMLCSDIKRYEANGLDEMTIYRLNEEGMKSFIRLVDLIFNVQISLTELHHAKEKLPIQSRSELKINGNHLLSFFPDRKRGSWIKQTLDKIEEAVVTGKVHNQYDEIKEWLKWNPIETN